MRTRTIPAQITTVEDKIAGNLNLTQILILMVPVFWATIVFALFPPTMLLVAYKLVLTFIALAICTLLAMRIKGKVVANWLVILLHFNLRPKYYVFNKNDTYLRELDLPKKEITTQKVTATEIKSATIPTLNIQELIKLDYFLTKEKLNLRFTTAKKGGLNVAFEKITK